MRAYMEDGNMHTTQITCKPCVCCGKSATITVESAKLAVWRSGKLVQEAFPTLSADERELLISGTHPECWEALFNQKEQ